MRKVVYFKFVLLPLITYLFRKVSIQSISYIHFSALYCSHSPIIQKTFLSAVSSYHNIHDFYHFCFFYIITFSPTIASLVTYCIALHFSLVLLSSPFLRSSFINDNFHDLKFFLKVLFFWSVVLVVPDSHYLDKMS